ncbi:hypothetical protein BDZ97DRAFT_188204 [Flammula alnicola]|nr:hypothetical protein BDZ97DRAFT_188204 [Flammula alnicola]
MTDSEILTNDSDIERHNDDRPYLSCKMSEGQPCPPCMSLLDIEQEIAELVVKRRSIKSLVNQNHDSISHQVPLEVASLIFTFFVPIIDESTRGWGYKKLVYAPLTLGAVCRKWRQIAWSTPYLWTTICINLLTPKSPQLKGQLVQEWLNRSGDLPLSIYIYHNNDFKPLPKELEPIFRLIDIINQYSHRWYLLDLKLPSSLVSRFGRGSHSSTILQKLHLTFSNTSPLKPDHHLFSLDNVLPMLQEVVLTDIPLNSVAIDWNNVTFVEARNFHVDECIELLRRAPRIDHCAFWDVGDAQETATISETIVVHPTLRSLSFELEDASDVDIIFLGRVSCPSLTSFTYNDHVYSMSTDAIVSFLTRSGCSLHHMNIGDIDSGTEAYVKLLRTIPTLHDLDLSPDGDILTNFLPLLVSPIPIESKNPESECPFLPHLKAFTYSGIFDFSWEQVLALYGPEYQSASSTQHAATINPENCYWRRLHFLTMKLDTYEDWYRPLQEDMYIKKDTLLQFMRLQNEGIELTFVREGDTVLDIIQASKILHGLSEENDGNCEA